MMHPVKLHDSIASILNILKQESDEQERALVTQYIRQCISDPPELIIITCFWFYFQLSHNDWYPRIDSFDELSLKDELLCGVYEYGLDKPTLIQKRSLLPLINGHDVIVKAWAGTGKSITISIAALQCIDLKQPQCQVLIIVPTRSLALQQHGVCCTFT